MHGTRRIELSGLLIAISVLLCESECPPQKQRAKMLLPFQILMIPLALFTSFLQAMVFTMLTCVYIAGFVAHEEGHEHGHGHGHGPGEEHGVLTDSLLPAPPV